jgi:hypothetical protein
MKRICIVGLCLVTMFAVSAAIASSASATEFPLFVPLSGKTFPIKFHGLVTTETKLQTLNSETKCKKIHIEGEILTVHLIDTHYLFLECEEPELAAKCKTAGAPEGDIVLVADEHLGLVDDPSGNLFNDPGVLLLIPAGFKFECSIFDVPVVMTGSFIAQLVSPTDVQRHEAEFEYKSVSAGEPLFTLFLSPLIGTVHALLLTQINGGAIEKSSKVGRESILLLPATETVEIT